MVSPVYPGTPASAGLNPGGGLVAVGVLDEDDDWLAAPGGVGMLIVAFIQGEGVASPPRADFWGG